jgi:hypothetical protein
MPKKKSESQAATRSIAFESTARLKRVIRDSTKLFGRRSVSQYIRHLVDKAHIQNQSLE